MAQGKSSTIIELALTNRGSGINERNFNNFSSMKEMKPFIDEGQGLTDKFKANQ